MACVTELSKEDSAAISRLLVTHSGFIQILSAVSEPCQFGSSPNDRNTSTGNLGQRAIGGVSGCYENFFDEVASTGGSPTWNETCTDETCAIVLRSHDGSDVN